MAQNTPGIRPHLTVSDAAAALDFLAKACGAVEIHERVRMPGDHRIMHAEVEIAGTVVYLNDEFPEMTGGKSRNPLALGGTPMLLHQFVENCDEAMERAVNAGAKVIMPAADQFWGDRYGVVEDPFGYHWRFAHRLTTPPPAPPF
jgi:PhnB protein